MATEKWIAGALPLDWSGTALMTTDLNSLANGNALLGSVVIANDTNLDLTIDFSLKLASLAGAAPNFVGLFLYPLHDDGSTYGDGRFGSAAAMTAANAPFAYFKGNFSMLAATQAQYGVLENILIRPGKYKPVLWNQMGVAFASSGNTLKGRTANRSIL